jgi:hypothetical protein
MSGSRAGSGGTERHHDEPVARAFLAAARTAKSLGIRPILFGGLAVNVRSQGRFTDDVDLILDASESRAAEIIAAFKQAGLEMTDKSEVRLARDAMANARLGDTRIDILLPCDPLTQAVVREATDHELDGEVVGVARPEELILMKLIARRANDIADIQALLVCNRDQLDFAAIRRWLPDLDELQPGATDLFERLKREFHDPLPARPALS